MEGPGEPLGKQKRETCKAVFKSELSISHISRAALLYPANRMSQHSTKAFVRQV